MLYRNQPTTKHYSGGGGGGGGGGGDGIALTKGKVRLYSSALTGP